MRLYKQFPGTNPAQPPSTFLEEGQTQKGGPLLHRKGGAPGPLTCNPLSLVLTSWYGMMGRGKDTILETIELIWEKWKLTPSNVIASNWPEAKPGM